MPDVSSSQLNVDTIDVQKASDLGLAISAEPFSILCDSIHINSFRGRLGK